MESRYETGGVETAPGNSTTAWDREIPSPTAESSYIRSGEHAVQVRAALTTPMELKK